MPRQIEILTPARVAEIKAASVPGLYSDGAGLNLRIGPNGSASWALRYSLSGRSRERGLGSAATVDLKEARKRAKVARAEVYSGKDVVAERRAARKPPPGIVTFKTAAERYIEKHSGAWKNVVHAAQWPSTLKRYVYPVLGQKSVAEITVADVERVLAPIWTCKVETANRVRSRIQLVLDFATASEWRSGDNPAARQGPLQHRLPQRPKIAKKHHAALDHRGMAPFMARLRAHAAMSAKCAEFAILTAARSSEARSVTWREIDLAAKIWTVPGDRMKGSRDHLVPLSDAAMALLESMPRDDDDGLIFPGAREGRPLSDVGLGKIVKICAPGVPVTLHGFRSAFRDFAGDETDAARETAEAALAHAVGDKAEQAYRRGTALRKRAALMQAWATWCSGAPPAGVVNIEAARARRAAPGSK